MVAGAGVGICEQVAAEGEVSLDMKMILAAAAGIFAVVVLFFYLAVSLYGGNGLSLKPSDWAYFATYFNGLATPIVTVVAIMVAYHGIYTQIQQKIIDDAGTADLRIVDKIIQSRQQMSQLQRDLESALQNDWRSALSNHRLDEIHERLDTAGIRIQNIFSSVAEAIDGLEYLSLRLKRIDKRVEPIIDYELSKAENTIADLAFFCDMYCEKYAGKVLSVQKEFNKIKDSSLYNNLIKALENKDPFLREDIIKSRE